MKKYTDILIHYHEIALKGKNRIFFEQKLVDNIKKVLNNSSQVHRLNGRILASDCKSSLVLKKLQNIFGISSYSPALMVNTDMKNIKKGATDIIDLEYKNKKQTFKVETKRSYKQFPLNSMEISKEVGAHILKKYNFKVDVKKPKIIVNIEILKNKTFVYTKKIKGAGGLPVGTSGKMLVLISGGIDSPVSAYSMFKRGSELDFIHFYSYPFTDKASIEKVQEILKVLKKYQGIRRLFLAPIIDFQKEIVKKTEAKYRIILYRRLMYKVAEKIAQKYSAKALVSGDSLGQVASQTVENMSAIGHGLDMPIMRPLIGYDKEEIIDLAKKIGTFELSIEPHGDCCSVFLPRNPVTKARLVDVLKEEKKINIEKWVSNIIKKVEIK